MKDEAEILQAEDAEAGAEKIKKRGEIKLSEKPSDLLSKEGFAIYVGKTPRAVVEMAKAGKLPAFYMVDPMKPGGHAELWINRKEWDKYADQLVEMAPPEWHEWKSRISHAKEANKRSRKAA